MNDIEYPRGGEDMDQPVTRRECSLYRAKFEQRVEFLKTDLDDIKGQIKEIVDSLDKYSSEQSAKWGEINTTVNWVLRVSVAVLVGVLLGRGLDLSWIAG